MGKALNILSLSSSTIGEGSLDFFFSDIWGPVGVFMGQARPGWTEAYSGPARLLKHSLRPGHKWAIKVSPEHAHLVNRPGRTGLLIDLLGFLANVWPK